MDPSKIQEDALFRRFYESCGKGDANYVQAFINEVKDINRFFYQMDVRTGTTKGGTALISACKNRHSIIVKLLLERNDIDVNKAHLFQTPLHAACYAGDIRSVSLLLDRPEIEVNGQDNAEQTPLMLALRSRFDALVELLLTHPKVDLTLKDFCGKTAIDYANSWNNKRIILLLEERLRKDKEAKSQIVDQFVNSHPEKSHPTTFERGMETPSGPPPPPPAPPLPSSSSTSPTESRILPAGMEETAYAMGRQVGDALSQAVNDLESIFSTLVKMSKASSTTLGPSTPSTSSTSTSSSSSDIPPIPVPTLPTTNEAPLPPPLVQPKPAEPSSSAEKPRQPLRIYWKR